MLCHLMKIQLIYLPLQFDRHKAGDFPVGRLKKKSQDEIREERRKEREQEREKRDAERKARVS